MVPKNSQVRFLGYRRACEYVEHERIDLTKLNVVACSAGATSNRRSYKNACCLMQRWKTANGLSTVLHTCAGSPVVCLLLHKRGTYVESTVIHIRERRAWKLRRDRRCERLLFAMHSAGALYERASRALGTPLIQLYAQIHACSRAHTRTRTHIRRPNSATSPLSRPKSAASLLSRSVATPLSGKFWVK